MHDFFEKVGPTPWAEAIAVEDSAVVQCCARALATRVGTEHRWSCCALKPDPTIYVDPAWTEAIVDGLACTPWGPPTPPMAHPTPQPGAREPTILDLRARARAVGLALVDEPDLAPIREAAIATWRERMRNEYGSAEVFAALADQLARAGLREAAARCHEFAGQERRHGIECGAVVEALGGQASCRAIEPPSYPRHLDASDELEAILRNVISICCMSETVAVALITAEREQMPAGPLRDCLTGILADEVAHARFGWRLLDALVAELSPSAREGITRYLPIAFAHLVEHELSHLPTDWVPPPQGAVYGLCDGRQARRLFARVVSDAIVPGLRARGLAA